MASALKKLSFLLCFLVLFCFLSYSSQCLSSGLPLSTSTIFKVLNVSQDNKDAQVVCAFPGDVLRYEFSIKSDSEPVDNFVFSMDVSMILTSSEIIDPGLGKLTGTVLAYPPFTHDAPCEQVFTFFVRVKENCGGLSHIITVTKEGNLIVVPLVCLLAGQTEPATCPTERLTITSPSLNSKQLVGETITILWTTLEITGNVIISISRLEGKDGTFENIAETTNDGSHTWTVVGPETANCVLKIETANYLPVYTLFNIVPHAFFNTVNSNFLGDPAHKGISAPSAGFGVNAVTGNFFHEEVDAAMPGKDIPFAFTRFYNSLSDNKDSFGADLPQPFGPGWTHGYNIILRTNADKTLAEVIWGDGRHDGFGRTDSTWHGDTPGNFSSLAEITGQTYSWEVTTKNQIRYRFNSAGQLTAIVGRSGHSMNFTYTGSDLTGITDTAGRTITLTYSSGLLTKVDLPPSRHFDFQYTAAGLLSSVIDMIGNSHPYVYDVNKKLIQIHRANQNPGVAIPLIQITYDADGRVTEQKTGYNLANPDTGKYIFGWGANSLQYRSPTGKGSDYTWDSQLRVTQITPVNLTDATPLSISYGTSTGAGSILPQTATDYKGKEYAYIFDGPNLNTMTDPLSQNYQQTWNTKNDLTGFETPAQLKSTITPTAFGSPQSITFAAQGGISSPISASFSYYSDPDVIGLPNEINMAGTAQSQAVKTKVISYHADGQPLEVQRFVNSTTALKTNYEYDAAGRLKGEKDHRGTWTCYYYDNNDNITNLAAGITDAACPAAPPNASASIRHILLEYDSDNRLTKRSEGQGSDIRRDMTYTYNDNAGVLAHTYDHGSSRHREFWYDNDLALNKIIEDSTEREDRFYRHADNRIRISAENANSSAETIPRITRRTYDANGQLETVNSCAGLDSVGECTGTIERQRIIRDDLGRPSQIKETVSEGVYRVTNYQYSSGGRIMTVTRGTGTDQTSDIFEYNGMGQLIKVTQNGSVTSAFYDTIGRLVKVSDPQGLETTYTYDGLGRMTSRTDIQGTVQLKYDDANGKITRTESGAARTYTYDRLGQLTKIETSDGNTFSYAYNSRGMMISENWSGTGGTGSRTYAYDIYGDVTGITGPFEQTFTYNRGDLGRIDSKVFAGSTIKYYYDGLYQLKRMDTPAGVFNFYYDNFTGALGKTVFPNTGSTQYARNLLGELTSLIYQQPGGGSPMISYDITLDSLGRRKSISADQPIKPQFIPEEAVLSYSDNPVGQLLTLNGQSVTHDARGNITALPEPAAETFSYDALNRLTNVNTAQHSYDSARNRIETTRNGIKTRYLQDVEGGLPDVLASMDESNTVQEMYIHGPGGLLATVKDGATRFVHQDFNSNVIALTDGTTGEVKASFAYTPQGKWAGSSGEDTFPFRFAGGVGAMSDPEGVIYMRARYYHPGIRQFTSPDLISGSIGSPQSLGRYAYVEGMAMGGVDTSGLGLRTHFYDNSLREQQKGAIKRLAEIEELLLNPNLHDEKLRASLRKERHMAQFQVERYTNEYINNIEFRFGLAKMVSDTANTALVLTAAGYGATVALAAGGISGTAVFSKAGLTAILKGGGAGLAKAGSYLKLKKRAEAGTQIIMHFVDGDSWQEIGKTIGKTAIDEIASYSSKEWGNFIDNEVGKGIAGGIGKITGAFIINGQKFVGETILSGEKPTEIDVADYFVDSISEPVDGLSDFIKIFYHPLGE